MFVTFGLALLRFLCLVRFPPFGLPLRHPLYLAVSDPFDFSLRCKFGLLSLRLVFIARHQGLVSCHLGLVSSSIGLLRLM